MYSYSRYTMLLALIVLTAVGGATFAYMEIEKPKIFELSESKILHDDKIKKLEQEIALLSVSVEELIGVAQEETKADIEKSLAEERVKLDELTHILATESAKRVALEGRIQSDSGLSIARIEELEAITRDDIDLVSIISEWRRRTANITCNFSFGRISGSGVLVEFNESAGGVYGILTNQHVLVDALNRSALSCSITFPDFNQTITVIPPEDRIEISTDGLDFGRLVPQTLDNALKNVAAREGNICISEPSVGDDLIILGYPVIGSTSDITATDGIVSGFDGDYYITSAKVEQGNSGGTAVLLKDNCLLGIPTFVQSGNLEALARILKIDVLY